jgi:hypothetical protein
VVISKAIRSSRVSTKRTNPGEEDPLEGSGVADDEEKGEGGEHCWWDPEVGGFAAEGKGVVLEYGETACTCREEIAQLHANEGEEVA